MLQLWLLIDPTDWMAQAEAITRPRAMAATEPPSLQRQRANATTEAMLKQHPPLIRKLFRLG